MRRIVFQSTAVLFACTLASGCLLNSVRPVTAGAALQPDSSHAIVVIGMGFEAPWQYPQFQLTLPEYSVQKQGTAGTCFHYNRIDVVLPSNSAKRAYRVYKVPSNAYAFPDLADTDLRASAEGGRAFVAPANSVVYFGDFIVTGSKTIELRRDIRAARAGTVGLLPGEALKLAETISAPGAHIPLCTP